MGVEGLILGIPRILIPLFSRPQTGLAVFVRTQNVLNVREQHFSFLSPLSLVPIPLRNRRF